MSTSIQVLCRPARGCKEVCVAYCYYTFQVFTALKRNEAFIMWGKNKNHREHHKSKGPSCGNHFFKLTQLWLTGNGFYS